MKTYVILLALAAGLLSGATVQGAIPVEQAYLTRQVSRPSQPVPVSVVSPSVGLQHVGAVIELVFTVDKNGKPREIRNLSEVPHDLASRVVYAISRWKFEPARDLAGEPKAMKVRLPVYIVDGEQRVDAFLAKR